MSKTVGISPKTMKLTFYLLLLALSLGCVSSARILDEVDPGDASDTGDVVPVTDPSTTLPSGPVPATVTPVGDVTPVAGPATTLPTGAVPVVAPVTTTTPPVVGAGAASTVIPPVATPVAATTPGDTTVTPPDTAPVATTTPTGTAGPATAAATGPAVPVGGANAAAPLSFFMHDILGGTHPSGRVVTGIVANSDVNNLPFSKPNSQIFPINGGVPLNSVTGVINNNNAPFLVGLNGSPGSTSIQNNGNNNNNNVLQAGGGGNNNNQLPFVSAGQLPTGLTLQQLMFGSVTVVDNELTEGHELGTAVVGKAQGFYLASSLDGTSHTLVLTVLLHGGGGGDVVDDTISFFGIHRTGSPLSEIAVIGGTGKYEDAKGYASIETLLNQQDQHTTDGVETITQFSVYLTP